MFKYDNRVKIPLGYDLKIDEYFSNLEKYNNNYRYRESYQNLLEFKTDRKEFLKNLLDNDKKEILKIIEDSIKNEKEKSNNFENECENNESRENFKLKRSSQNSNSIVKQNNSEKVLIFPSVNLNIYFI